MTRRDHQLVDAEPSHLGSTVRDLDEAMEFHSKLGILEWATSGWKQATYYDRDHDAVIEVRSRVAFGRLNSGMAREFIEVDPSGPVPSVWRLGHPDCIPHVGYWVENPSTIARQLVDSGCRLLLARASNDGVRSLRRIDLDAQHLPDVLDACYFSSDTGVLVELVPKAIFTSRLPATFGEAISRMLPAPSTRHTS
jgi:glyoxalase/bleomycin resistance protein/dioxygenase superfamily protein